MAPKKDFPVKRPVVPPAKPAAKPAGPKPGFLAGKSKVPETAPVPPAAAPEKPKEPPIDLSKVVVSEAWRKSEAAGNPFLSKGRRA